MAGSNRSDALFLLPLAGYLKNPAPGIKSLSDYKAGVSQHFDAFLAQNVQGSFSEDVSFGLELSLDAILS